MSFLDDAYFTGPCIFRAGGQEWHVPAGKHSLAELRLILPGYAEACDRSRAEVAAWEAEDPEHRGPTVTKGTF